MEIIEILGPDDDLTIGQFLEVSSRVYRDDPVWAPESENGFLDRFRASRVEGSTEMWPVVALENGVPVARAVAIHVSEAVDETGRPQGWIGFFEVLRGHRVAARRVLSRCEERLRAAGIESILAPKADNQLFGLLIDGFELPHMVLTNHNPPYYLEVFQECGYQICTRILTVIFNRETYRPFHVAVPGFTTRELDRQNLAREVRIFNQLQGVIFADRPGYVPRTLDEDRGIVQSFLPFLEENLVIIAESNEGAPVGLAVCVPDVYQALRGQTIDRVRLMTIGVIPDLRRRGIGVAMCSHLMRNLLRTEYQMLEAGGILESNVVPQNLAKRFGARRGREFALLRKWLGCC